MIVLPRTRQPQRVAKANPKYRAWLTFNGAVPLHNAGAGVAWQQSTGGVTPIVGPAGQALRFAGGANTGKWSSTIPAVSGNLTVVFVVANLNGAAGGGPAGRIISGFNGTTFAPFDIYVDGSNRVHLVREFSTTDFDYASNANIGSGANPSVFVAWLPCTAGVAPNLWVDGVEQSWFSTIASVGTVAAANSTIAIGGRPDVTTRQISGDIYMAAVLDGFVPPSIIPWQVFEPETLFVKTASVAGSFKPYFSNQSNVIIGGGFI